MPLRSPKMYSFIFGFQRRGWGPKGAPASSSSFMVKVATGRLLAFRPLEALARALLAVLLALLHPRVAGEEAALAELGFQLGIRHHQGPGQPQAHRARLAGAAAAGDADFGVELVGGADKPQRLAGMLPPGGARKELFQLAAVHPDAAAARADVDAGHRSLAAPRAVKGSRANGGRRGRRRLSDGFGGGDFGGRARGFLVAHWL